jgi:hypothetical protein
MSDGITTERRSEAQSFLIVCGTRVAKTATPIVDDPWCRALLDSAAGTVMPVGLDGRMWTFGDQSQLIANRQAVVATRAYPTVKEGNQSL